MDAGVFGELGVEGGGEEAALADEGGGGVARGEGLDGWAGAGDAGGADEDHLERAAGEGGVGGEDGGVVLAAVGVALDRDVEYAEGGLVRVAHFLGEEDAAGAGAEDGLRVNEGVEGVVEAGAFEMLEEGGGLAAGDDEGVESVELAGLADESGDGSEGRETAGVDVERALQSEDADGWGFGIHSFDFSAFGRLTL